MSLRLTLLRGIAKWPFKRRGVALYEGANVTLTVDDDPDNEAVNVTIAASGSSGTPASTVAASTTYGQSSAVGTGTDYARNDHVHGTPALGTSGSTACAGNDARLSDSRAPTAHQSLHRVGGSDALPTGDATTPGLLKLGASGGACNFADTRLRTLPAAISTTNLALDLNADLGVTLTSSAVSAWASQVGTLVAAQATSSKRPIVGTWGRNGHSCINFDGTDDILIIPWESAIDWSVLTVYVVARVAPSSSGTMSGSPVVGRAFSLAAGTPFYEWMIYASSDSAYEVRTDGTLINSVTLPNASTNYSSGIYVMSVGATGGSMHYNGRRGGTSATTSITYANSLGIGIGARSTTTEGEWARWQIARILLYSVQHTAAQRNAILLSLSEEYGTPIPINSETA